MEIQELNLKHYGKFENHRIPLRSGMNIIYGGNESGKTTLHSFIRSMLFGLGRARGKAARKDEYQLRRPWDNPGSFSGSMTLREGGKVYRIDRNFDSRSAELSMVCVTDSREFREPEEGIRDILGGISESAFLNTVFIGQGGSGTDESLAEELRRCMVNGGSGQDLGLDVTKALQSLRKKKKLAEQKKKKEEEALEEQISKKQTEADYIRRELGLLEQQLSMSRGQEPPEEETWEEEDSMITGAGRIVLVGLLLLAGVLALLGAALLPGVKVKWFLGIFGAVFLLLILPVQLLLSPGRRKEPPETERPETEREAFLREEKRKREEAYRRLQEELEVLYQGHVRLEGPETEIAALNLAIDRICELTMGIYEETGGNLNKRASRILGEITNGRYDRIVMDETGEIRIHTADRVLGLHQVSGGTMQQIYFAVRMAAGEVFCGEQKLPVVLDEPFAMYDDARLEAVLRWLDRCGRQVILFTCQKRERELLNRIRQAEYR